MRIIHHISESGKFKTDVEFCGGFVLVTVDDWDERENGRLDIYRRYDKATEEMELFHSIFGKVFLSQRILDQQESDLLNNLGSQLTSAQNTQLLLGKLCSSWHDCIKSIL